jgi:hypothetical protein
VTAGCRIGDDHRRRLLHFLVGVLRSRGQRLERDVLVDPQAGQTHRAAVKITAAVAEVNTAINAASTSPTGNVGQSDYPVT